MKALDHFVSTYPNAAGFLIILGTIAGIVLIIGLAWLLFAPEPKDYDLLKIYDNED